MDWENAERTSWVIPGTPPLQPLEHIYAALWRRPKDNTNFRTWQSKTFFLIFLLARFHLNWVDWSVTWKVFNCSFALGPNMDITEGSRASFMDKLMQGSQKCNFESWQMELIYLSQRTGRPLPHVALWFKVSIYHRYDPTPHHHHTKGTRGTLQRPKVYCVCRRNILNTSTTFALKNIFGNLCKTISGPIPPPGDICSCKAQDHTTGIKAGHCILRGATCCIV